MCIQLVQGEWEGVRPTYQAQEKSGLTLERPKQRGGRPPRRLDMVGICYRQSFLWMFILDEHAGM